MPPEGNSHASFVFVLGTGLEAVAPSYLWLMVARVVCAAR